MRLWLLSALVLVAAAVAWPGPHHVYARVYYKRAGSAKLRRKTVVRRFTVCA